MLGNARTCVFVVVVAVVIFSRSGTRRGKSDHDEAGWLGLAAAAGFMA